MVQFRELEIRKPDAAIREIREHPTFAASDLCDRAKLSARRNLIQAEHTQFCAANDALAVFFNLASYPFDLRFQRRAIVPHVLGERVQTLKIIYSGNKAIVSSSGSSSGRLSIAGGIDAARSASMIRVDGKIPQSFGAGHCRGDLYELLEKVIDRCRDTGNIILQVVLKYS